MLLNMGANPIFGNKLGTSPVHRAAEAGKHVALEEILKHDPSIVNVLSGRKDTPLHVAARHDNVECAAVLLRYGANGHIANIE